MLVMSVCLNFWEVNDLGQNTTTSSARFSHGCFRKGETTRGIIFLLLSSWCDQAHIHRKLTNGTVRQVYFRKRSRVASKHQFISLLFISCSYVHKK